MNPRLCAAIILKHVLFEHQSLSEKLNLANKSQQVNLTKELCFGVCRHYFQLAPILNQLMSKPIKAKEAEIECLLLTGLYELIYLNTAEYASVSDIVDCTRILKKNWASKLVNAILRNFLRNKDTLLEKTKNNPEAQYNHPSWLIKKIRSAWPDNWEEILTADNTPAPLTLRINQQKISAEDYLQLLNQEGIKAATSPVAKQALILESARPVLQLPKFSEGFVSVQDVNAQLAATFLRLAPGLSVLDACAAPGGKTAHIMETEPGLEKLIALDQDAKRIEKIHENLQRLKLSAKTVTANAENLDAWWDKQCFDRILLDAPCSATGVIRRHPDIKLLRQNSDIANVIKLQRVLLNTLWQTLKPGGLFLYATCSILPEENRDNIQWFLETTPTAKLLDLPIQSRHSEIGLQLLPGENSGDGFFYCLMQKIS